MASLPDDVVFTLKLYCALSLACCSIINMLSFETIYGNEPLVRYFVFNSEYNILPERNFTDNFAKLC